MEPVKVKTGELRGNPVGWEIVTVLWSEKLEKAFALSAKDPDGTLYSIEPETPGPLRIMKSEKPGGK